MNFFEIGNTYFENGDFKQAVEYFQKGFTTNPNENKFLIKMCISFYELKEYSQAIHFANQSLKMNPANPDAIAYRAYSYLELQQYALAELDFTYLIELDPFDEFFYLYRSNVRRKQGKFIESDKDLKKYDLLSDKSTEFFFKFEEKTIQDADLDDFNTKKKELDSILEEDPHNHLAHFNLGVAYTKLGAFKSAIDEYTKAMEFHPEKLFKEALYNRANAYYDNGQYEECLKDIETFSKEFSVSPYLEEIVSMINEETGSQTKLTSNK